MKPAIQTVIKAPRHFTTASGIFRKSCYSKVDYKINQNECVQQAVIRFAALDIGCIAVVDDEQKFVGLFSEGDFIKKVASSGKEAASIQLKEICTQAPNVLIVKPDDTLEDCMGMMHLKKISTHTREMRNSAILSVAIFAALSVLLTPYWGSSGMWFAMVAWIIMRTLTLVYYFPRIRRNLY